MNKLYCFNETWKPVITAKAQLLLSASCSDFRNGNLPAPDFLLLSRFFSFQKDLGSEAKTQHRWPPTSSAPSPLSSPCPLLLLLPFSQSKPGQQGTPSWPQALWKTSWKGQGRDIHIQGNHGKHKPPGTEGNTKNGSAPEFPSTLASTAQALFFP